MTRYDNLLARGRARHGAAFDDSALDPRFRRWYDSGERVRVAYTFPSDPGRGDTQYTTGTIGATTGSRPAFLLMRKRTDRGSSYVIGPRDVVVAVKRGRVYVPVGQEPLPEPTDG